MEIVTADDRAQFTMDMYLALCDQMAAGLATLTPEQFMIADRTLRHAVAVLFLESVAPASLMMQ